MQADSPTDLLFKVWPWIEANRNRLIGGAGLLAVAALVIAFFTWQRDQKDTAANQALTEALLTATPGGDAAAPYLKVAADFPGTRAAARALLQGATRLYTANQFAEAQKKFQQFLDSYSESRFAAQAALGLAACLDAQGQAAAAIKAYQNVISQYSDDNVMAEAKFSLAHLYDSQNRLMDARNLYEEVARTYPYTSLGQEAAVRLQELKLKHPAPVAATPVATNPAVPRHFMLSSTNPAPVHPQPAATGSH